MLLFTCNAYLFSHYEFSFTNSRCIASVLSCRVFLRSTAPLTIVPCNGQLPLTGISEGAHVAAAAQKGMFDLKEDWHLWQSEWQFQETFSEREGFGLFFFLEMRFLISLWGQEGIYILNFVHSISLKLGMEYILMKAFINIYQLPTVNLEFKFVLWKQEHRFWHNAEDRDMGCQILKEKGSVIVSHPLSPAIAFSSSIRSGLVGAYMLTWCSTLNIVISFYFSWATLEYFDNFFR